ncbi:short-chain dehydrogenase [Mycolicibacillus koreensis]|nr:short-chain dehydrogenase [Mycolicibacillus koreensis]
MTHTSLTGRVVAITGGARGIGLATAKAFVAAGAKVAIGDLDAGRATSAAASIAGEGQLIALPLDVTSPQAFAAFLDDTERRLGPLDIVVNNAGVMLTGAFLEETPATADAMIDINLRGVVTGCKLAAQRFIRQGSGTIINVASMAGVAGFPGVATYCATKFGVVGLTLALREELKEHQVAVCAILPGIVHTELSAGIDLPGVIERFGSVEPEDIAAAVVATAQNHRALNYVPRRLSGTLATAKVLPERLRRWVFRVTRTDQAYLAVDQTARDAYHRRATGAEVSGRGGDERKGAV